MENNIKLKISGMTCPACELKIERKLKNTNGISNVIVSWPNASVDLTYDNSIVQIEEIESLIKALGYGIVHETNKKTITKKSIKVYGMEEGKSEVSISKQLLAIIGINNVNVVVSDNKVEVMYEETKLDIKDIKNQIEVLGYEVGDIKTINETSGLTLKLAKLIGMLAILLLVFVMLNSIGVFNVVNIFPTAEVGTGLGMLFVIGLLTSVHCVAMCGGINISQNIKQTKPSANCQSDCNTCESKCKNSKPSTLRSSFLYNLGRVISYTLIGGVIGAIGSIISFSNTARGIVMVFAAAFMILMGLNMFGTFSFLKKLTPRMPKFIARFVDSKKEKSKSPFVVGLLNGFMPCGPLQAMQIYAISTGSFFLGALSMAIFALGTVPLMFALGAVSSLLTKKFTKKLMTASAGLVIILGMFMFTNGAALSGIELPTLSNSGGTAIVSTLNLDNNTQSVSFDLGARSYRSMKVKEGIPVILTIRADANNINNCNNELRISKYKIAIKLVEGDNIITFTPDNIGTISYSCWMGMIKARIIVTK